MTKLLVRAVPLMVALLLWGCRTPDPQPSNLAASPVASQPRAAPDGTVASGAFGPWSDPDALPNHAVFRVGSRRFAAATVGAVSNDLRMIVGEHNERRLKLVRATDGARRVSRMFSDTLRFTDTGDALWLDDAKLWRIGADDDAQPTFIELEMCSGATRSAFSDDARWLVCVVASGEAVHFALVDVESAKLVREWTGVTLGHDVAVSNDAVVANFLQREHVEVWRADGTWRREMNANGIRFDHRGLLVVETNDIEVFDPLTQKRLTRIRFAETNLVRHIIPGREGTFFGAYIADDPDEISNGNVASVVQLSSSGETIRSWPFPGYPHVMTTSPDGRTLLAGSGEGALLVVDIEAGTELARSPDAQRSPMAWALSPSAEQIAVYRRDAVTLLEVSTGVELARFRVPRTVSKAFIEFSPDGKVLAAANSYGDLIMFDVAKRSVVCAREDVALHMMRWGDERLLTRRVHYRAEDLDDDGEEQEMFLLDRSCKTIRNDHIGEFAVLLPSPAGEALTAEIMWTENPNDARYNIVRGEIDAARFTRVVEDELWENFEGATVPAGGSFSRDGRMSADVELSEDGAPLLRCRRNQQVLSEYEVPDGSFQVRISDAGKWMVLADERTLLLYPCEP